MAAPIWPSCERWASSIRKATRSFFSSGFFSSLLQHPGELLLRGDDDRLALLQEARQVVGLPGDAHHVLEVGELLDVVPDVRVERFAVGEDET